MENITLIFSRTADHLGELVTRDGALTQFVVTKAGEARLDREIQAWQTVGITIFRDEETISETQRLFQMVKMQIQPRDPAFLAAFRNWATSNGLRIVTLRADALPCWEKILGLPFEPEERFAMVFALSRLRADQVGAWSSALDEARTVVEQVK